MRAPAQPVPGRLRLSFTQLKQQHAQLERMAASLGAVNGVITVDTNPIAGSLLIQFDSAVGKTPTFWDQIESVLHSFALMLNPRPLARMADKGAGPGPNGRSDNWSDPTAPEPDAAPRPRGRQALIHKLIERMAIAVMPALVC